MKWASPDPIAGYMKTVLPDPAVGAMVGFALGFFASANLALLGIDVHGWPAIGCSILGAVVGGVIGFLFRRPAGRARTVARWCATMTFVVGLVTFLIGFVGPILLRPDLPQGPLLGIFCTGPLGAVAGALLGAVIGLFVPAPSASP